MADIKCTTRSTAKETNQSQFFTGMPCSHGHLANRFTNDGKCVECNRIACKQRHDRKVNSNPVSLLKREAAKARKTSNLIKKEESTAFEKIRKLAGQNKKIAIKAGEITFYGTACKKCGSATRYTSNSQCVECAKVKSASIEKKIYDAQYFQNNKQAILTRCVAYYGTHKEKVAASNHLWAKNNEEKVRAIKRKHKANKRQISPAYVLATRVAAGVRISLHKKKCPKKSSTVEILGCSFEEFRRHLERQFTQGMCWERISDIHIDHIIPISSAKTEKEVIKLFHFTNLRPLWAKDNLSKGSKMLNLI